MRGVQSAPLLLTHTSLNILLRFFTRPSENHQPSILPLLNIAQFSNFDIGNEPHSRNKAHFLGKKTPSSDLLKRRLARLEYRILSLRLPTFKWFIFPSIIFCYEYLHHKVLENNWRAWVNNLKVGSLWRGQIHNHSKGWNFPNIGRCCLSNHCQVNMNPSG